MKPKTVRAWIIQRIADEEFSNRIFEKKSEAMSYMAVLSNLYFKVIRIEIRPLPTKKEKKR